MDSPCIIHTKCIIYIYIGHQIRIKQRRRRNLPALNSCIRADPGIVCYTTVYYSPVVNFVIKIILQTGTPFICPGQLLLFPLYDESVIRLLKINRFYFCKVYHFVRFQITFNNGIYQNCRKRIPRAVKRIIRRIRQIT